MSPRRIGMLLHAVFLLTASPGLPAEPGEALPTGALLRLGSPRLRQPYRKVPAVFLIMSADGKKLASRSDDRVVRVWDAGSGQLLHQLEDADAVTAFAFAPDGNSLATAGGGGIRLWDLATGKPTQQWQAHAGTVPALAFTPDGKTLTSCASDRSARLWEPASGKELRRFEKLGAVVTLAISPDGKTLAVGRRDSVVSLWDIATGRQEKLLEAGDGGRLFGIAFAPDGKSLALGSRTITRLWDIASGKELRQFGHPITDEVTSHNNDETLAFSPDGSLLATGGKNIRIWDTATGKEVRSFGEGRRRVTSVAFLDRKVLAVGGGDQEIHLWDMTTGTEARTQIGHQDRVQCVAFARDGQTVATGGADRMVFLWDAKTGALLRPLAGHDGGITAVDCRGDGRQVASADTGGIVRVWETATGKELHRFEAHQHWVTALAFSPDGKALASAGRDGRLRLYDIAKEREIHDFPKHEGGVTALAFSHDGKFMASGAGNGQVRIWKMDLGLEVPAPETEPDEDAPVFPTDPMPMQRSPVLLLLFTPDGKGLRSWLESGAIVLWDVASRKPLRQFDGPAGGGSGAAFSFDGRTLATRDASNQVILRETATGQERLLLPGHPGRDFVWALAFAPDGRRLVSVSDDTTALIWDVWGRPPDKLAARDLDAIWHGLASDNGGRAYRGIGALAANPGAALPFLRDKLKPLTVEPQQITQLVADLDSNQFAVRQKAVAALEELSELAEPALRKALEAKPPLEVKQRLEKLLAKVEKEKTGLNPHRLRVLRVTEVLERVGSAEARQMLEALVDAPPEMRLTDEVKQEVRACLERLQRRN